MTIRPQSMKWRLDAWQALILLSVSVLALMWLGLELVFGREAARSRELQGRLDEIELGMSEAKVRQRMGPPTWSCPGPLGFPHSVGFRLRRRSEEIRASLSQVTESRWLYLMRTDEEQPHCQTWYLDAVLGFDAQGRLIWLVRSSGEGPLEILDGLLEPR